MVMTMFDRELIVCRHALILIAAWAAAVGQACRAEVGHWGLAGAVGQARGATVGQGPALAAVHPEAMMLIKMRAMQKV